MPCAPWRRAWTPRPCSRPSPRSDDGLAAEEESAGSGGAGVGSGTGAGGESLFSMNRTRERAFLVFNPSPCIRQEVVEARLWDTRLALDRLVVTSTGTTPQRVQVLERGASWGHEFVAIAFPVEVPAFGYRAVLVSDRAADLGLLEGSDLVDAAAWGGVGGSWRQIQREEPSLENEYLRATIDPGSGGLTSLVDLRTDREWVPAGERCGALEHCVEENAGMTAWVIGRFLRREPVLSGQLQRVHTGPWLNGFRWEAPIGQRSRVQAEISVRQGLPRVNYRLTVDWREMGDARSGIPHLRATFPLAVHEPHARYEIPFGAIDRAESSGEEVPAQRWADVLEAREGAGVLLANTSKYGHRLDGNRLGLTLLRASIDPDPLPDIGEHVIEYGLVPHGRDWGVADAVREGERLNLPLVVASCDLQSGPEPVAHSFLRLRGAGACLAAAKLAQDGTGVVLRLVDVSGEGGRAQLDLDPRLRSGDGPAVLVDANEHAVAGEEILLETGADGRARVAVMLPPGGIQALKV